MRGRQCSSHGGHAGADASGGSFSDLGLLAKSAVRGCSLTRKEPARLAYALTHSCIPERVMGREEAAGRPHLRLSSHPHTLLGP